jgi:hypothetical protein
MERHRTVFGQARDGRLVPLGEARSTYAGDFIVELDALPLGARLVIDRPREQAGDGVRVQIMWQHGGTTVCVFATVTGIRGAVARAPSGGGPTPAGLEVQITEARSWATLAAVDVSLLLDDPKLEQALINEAWARYEKASHK